MGIFNVEGGSVCNVKRLGVLSYVAKDLPISSHGSTKHVYLTKARTFIENNQVVCGRRSLLPNKLSSVFVNELEFDSIFSHNSYALSLRCSDKPEYR